MNAAVTSEIALIRTLLAIIARNKDIEVSLSPRFTVEELLATLQLLEIEPGTFFETLARLDAGGGQLRSMLKELLGRMPALGEDLEILERLLTQRNEEES